MGKHDLRIDWATHEAAKYACVNWHYSGTVPAGKTVKLGAWERGVFIGSVIFSRGSNKSLGLQFGLGADECAELARVALRHHESSVSRVLSVCIRFLKSQSPRLRMIVSFADTNQGHHGGIYQAGNWIYAGYGTQDKRSRPYIRAGLVAHWRTVAGELSSRRLPSTVEAARSIGWKPQDQSPKHRYLMPLDAEMRERIMPLAKPYPKRAKQAMTDDQSAQRQGSTDPHAPKVHHAP